MCSPKRCGWWANGRSRARSLHPNSLNSSASPTTWRGGSRSKRSSRTCRSPRGSWRPMAIEPIVFTAEELTLIQNVIGQGGGWDNAALNPIRSRIKQFYLEGQSFRCCYCRRENVVQHGRAWDIEHVISRSL